MSWTGGHSVWCGTDGKKCPRSKCRLRLRQTYEPWLHLTEDICLGRVPEAGSAPVVVSERIDDTQFVSDRISTCLIGIHGDALGIRWAARRTSGRAVSRHVVVHNLIEVRNRIVRRAIAQRA